MNITIEFPIEVSYEEIENISQNVSGIIVNEVFASNLIREIKVSGQTPKQFYEFGRLIGATFPKPE